jgi:hypothetical protein
LHGAADKPFSAEQVEIARVKAELAKARMERDILKNRRGTRPPVAIETVARYPGCGRERPSTFWWRVTP